MFRWVVGFWRQVHSNRWPSGARRMKCVLARSASGQPVSPGPGRLLAVIAALLPPFFARSSAAVSRASHARLWRARCERTRRSAIGRELDALDSMGLVLTHGGASPPSGGSTQTCNRFFVVFVA